MARPSVILLMLVIVVKCSAASVPLDPSKIDFDRVNRDMRKPKFPFEPDLRQKPAHISQAHEVLRISLRSFLDLKDTNLTYYLDEMRKKNESYLDEFGNEIKGYRTIFSLILKQVDEMENNNYAVGQFEGDVFDLCSIAKYLSHQETFPDRQNIMTRMGDALDTKCDPSMPYKRKLYGKQKVSPVEKQEEKNNTNTSNSNRSRIHGEADAPLRYPAAITISKDDEDHHYGDDEEYVKKLCNHQSLDVYIRNSNTREFLYAAADHVALDKERRRVFTWKVLRDIPGAEGNTWAGEENWRIEPVAKSSTFRVKNTRYLYGPREYLFANSSDSVYVRRGLPDEESAVLSALGSSANWQLLARVAGELRGDLCHLNLSDIQGFVLKNEKYALGYLNAEEDDSFGSPNDVADDNKRRNMRISLESPSYWDILPISTYIPALPQIVKTNPTSPPRILKGGHNGASNNKWDIMNYTIILLVTNLIFHAMFCGDFINLENW